MFRLGCFSASLLVLSGATLSEPAALEADAEADAEADETCALQLKTSQVNCGGHFASSCGACDQGNGASWCNGVCQWDYNTGTCVPQAACCMAYNAQCLSCSAGVSEDVFCSQNTDKHIDGCPTACCKAYTATCLSCDAELSVDDYCSQNTDKNIPGCPVNPSTTLAPPQRICALCETCGGSYPASGGRITYFRDEVTQFSSYGEQCSGQERTRNPDGRVIFSPNLCCTTPAVPYAALLQADQEQEQAEKSSTKGQVQRRALSESDAGSNASSGAGWCMLCDQCGGGYNYMAGEITQLQNPPSNADDNSQNYEGYEGKCSRYGGTKGAPPAAKVCCMGQGHSSACSVCQNRCGGAYPQDGGILSYTTNGQPVKFVGYGDQCNYGMSNRVSYNSQGEDAPHLCCAL